MDLEVEPALLPAERASDPELDGAGVTDFEGHLKGSVLKKCEHDNPLLHGFRISKTRRT